jgi:hypothetical protein
MVGTLMKVMLTPEVTYKVSTNDGEIHNCHVVSRWNGFIELEFVQPRERKFHGQLPADKFKLIVSEPDSHGFTDVFAKVFGDPVKGDEVVLLKAPPFIIEILVPKAK